MIAHNNPNNQQVMKNNNYMMNQASTTMFGFANNAEEAKLMNLNRGYTQAYIFDLYMPVFYYKQIDASGTVIAFDTYEYDKVIPPEPEKPVSHDDLADMEQRMMSKFEAMLANMTNNRQNTHNTNKGERKHE